MNPSRHPHPIQGGHSPVSAATVKGLPVMRAGGPLKVDVNNSYRDQQKSSPMREKVTGNSVLMSSCLIDLAGGKWWDGKRGIDNKR